MLGTGRRRRSNPAGHGAFGRFGFAAERNLTALISHGAAWKPRMNAPLHFRSFFDLRQFARSSRKSGFEASGLTRRHVELPPGPVAVGALYVARGEHPESMDADEFVIACEGVVSLHVGAMELSLAPGESAVIHAGSSVRWVAGDAAMLVFMRYQAQSGQGPGLTPIDYGAELTPSGAPLAELLTTPAPACRNFTDYRSADGEFVCGTWDSTPYTRKAMRYRHYELMYLLDGEVSFEDEVGARATYVKGDIFLVRQGAECSWDSQEYVRKVYAIWRPA